MPTLSLLQGRLDRKIQRGLDGLIVMDDEDPELFKRFNSWLYTGNLVRDGDAGCLTWDVVFQTYIFAIKRLIPALQNAIIDAIVRGFLSEPIVVIPLEDIQEAYALTPERDPLRTLLVDLHVTYADLDISFKQQLEEYDIEFVAAVALRFRELLLNRDGFHNHPEDGYKNWQLRTYDLWKVRCERYHVHEAGDYPCAEAM